MLLGFILILITGHWIKIWGGGHFLLDDFNSGTKMHLRGFEREKKPWYARFSILKAQRENEHGYGKSERNNSCRSWTWPLGELRFSALHLQQLILVTPTRRLVNKLDDLTTCPHKEWSVSFLLFTELQEVPMVQVALLQTMLKMPRRIDHTKARGQRCPKPRTYPIESVAREEKSCEGLVIQLLPMQHFTSCVKHLWNSSFHWSKNNSI